MPHGMPTDISELIDSGEIKDLEIDDYLLERIRLIDYEYYRTAIHHGINPDLQYLNRRELLLHNIRRGRLEGRVYNPRILQYLDPDFYLSAYPELALKDNDDAKKHWLYEGAFQKRAPNSVTKQIMESCIHLFQMGKVGSKSIEMSLRTAAYTEHIMHLHFANEMISTYPDCYYSYPEIVGGSPCSISFVTGVREPISRILSGWIESTKSHASTMTLGQISDLIEDHRSLEMHLEKEIDIITDWFKHKFYCDLDVYSVPFDHECGFAIISGGRHRLFVYTVERLDKLWPLLSQFLGHDLQCIRINKTRDKGTVENQLQKRISTIKFSERIIDKAFNNRYARHFWSTEDIRRFEKKYSSSS